MAKETGINSRGAAIVQKKDWKTCQLAQKTRFVHCGSCPFPPTADKLDKSRGLEECKVAGTPNTKFILGFPFEIEGCPDSFVLPKPCQLMWDMAEMPRGFIFELPAGTSVWTDNGKVTSNQEVGFDFDIVFLKFLVAVYTRKNKTTMEKDPAKFMIAQ